MNEIDVSARLPAIVQQERLGAHRATYPAALVPARKLQAAGALTVVAAALGAIGLATGIVALAVFGLALAVFIGFRAIQLTIRNRQKKGQQLLLFEHGLICVGRGGRLTSRRWDTTTVYQNIVRHYRNGVPIGTSYVYRLIDPTGDTLALAGGFQRPTEWGPAIQQAVTNARLPEAIATIQAGGALTFGNITLDRQNVSVAGKHIPWAQIQEIRVKDGSVSLRVAGKWLPLTTTMVRSIPNFFVFHALADRLRITAADPGQGY